MQVSKARMDRNVAAGYDPNAEWGSNSILAGEDMTDLGDNEEEEEELQGSGAEGMSTSSAGRAYSADNADLPEIALDESDEVCSLPCCRKKYRAAVP